MKNVLKGLLLTGAVCTSLMAYNKVEAKDAAGNIVIVIDAGHGGVDPGAIAGEIYEKNINLSIALKLKDYCNK